MLTVCFWVLNSLALDVLESAQIPLSLEALELEGRDGSAESYRITRLMTGEGQRRRLLDELRRMSRY